MMGMAAAYKALATVKQSVKDFAEFELGLANVSTMLNDQTMVFLPAYEKQLTKLAKRYGQSTKALTKGLYDILSASIAASKATDVLEASTKAAIGGMTDAGIAADALTTIINAYQLSAEDATRVSDVLFATVKRGKITFGELASSIGTVASIAASVGLTIEEASAAISTMTRAGVKSDRAMTALRAILATFLSPTDEAREAAKRFGLELNTSTIRAIGLTGALKKLTFATEEEIAAIFPNRRALVGVAAVRQNLTGLVEDYEFALNSAGKAEEAYQKIAVTTHTQLEKNKEMWASLKRDLGKGIAPAVNLWLQGMDSIANGSRDAVDEIIKQFGRVSPAIKAITFAFSVHAKVKDKLVGGHEEFQAMLIAETDKWKKVNDAILTTSIRLQTLSDNRKKIIDESKRIKTTWAAEEQAARIQAKLTKELTKEQIKAGLVVTDSFKLLKLERSLIGLTNDERFRAIKLLEFETQAKILSADKSGELVKMYEGELKANEELRKEHERAIEVQKEFQDTLDEGMRGVIRSPLTALLDETRDVGQVLKDEVRNLAEDILKTMYEEAIVNPVMTAIKEAVEPAMKEITNEIAKAVKGVVSTAASTVANIIKSVFGGGAGAGAGGGTGAGAGAGAGGGKSSMQLATAPHAKGGAIKRMAKGDILSGPTIFPMSNGGLALGGERGKEGLLPLGRDSQGRLGVRTAGDDTQASERPLKIVLVSSMEDVNEHLSTGTGEEVIVNIMRRNAHLINNEFGM